MIPKENPILGDSPSTGGLGQRHRSDRGDTLIEILMTLVVLSITVVSLLLAFSTSIAASAEHRNLAVSDNVLRSVSESVFAQFQLVTNPANTGCPGDSGQFKSALAVPAPYDTKGYQATLTVAYWTSNALAPFDPSAACVAGYPQQLTVSVTGPGGSRSSDYVVQGTGQVFITAFSAPTQVVLSGCSSNIALGATCTATATLEDVNGNTVISYNGNVAFSQTSGAGSVTGLGIVTSFTNGVASAALTGSQAGPVTIDAVGDTFTSNSVTFSVTSAPTHVVLSGCSSSIASGATCTATATLEDASGNTISSYNGSVAFNQTSGSGSLSGLGSVTTFTNGVAIVVLTGNKAGSVTIDAVGDSFTSNANTLTVTPGAAFQLAFTPTPSGAHGGFTVVVTVEDAAGNTLTSDNTDTIALAKASGGGNFSYSGAKKVTNGVATWIGCTWSNSGAKTLTATSGAMTLTSPSFTLS
jgi:type II secretory pathway pseudopilin PulG